ncbi:GTP cyclohydrolase II [Neptunomonas phycophila]|uniref:GTP cyclohydrolase-2 n=1 Tax=Neptunomonas phycophila TaxID=1572645 RepID=A0ABT9EX81_9GAMM|nr:MULTISPECIES: GTP cyclohydrolase II [Neptunomonas]MDN2660694.1 GTP cyclohydrolase II [Neptunomonas sp. CHC150]MDO6468056.1 GTP cyclohydrolase II [Neptunomonas phycophila]MDP2523651.1 GTP cyclohydrolase II [Neptunomonas phycophila]
MTIEYVADSKLPMPWGTFTMVGFEDTETGKDHIALVYGDVSGDEPVLARIHSECLTGDALFSLRCDCGFQLQEALKRISEAGRGVLLYLRQEGRGIGLLNKIKAYHLQDQGADTVEANEQLGFAADMRDYSMCDPMLAHLGIKSVNLMTNNPRKVAALKTYGVNVAERVPLQVGKNSHNEQYLATKMGKLGHMMTEEHFNKD